MWRGAELSRFHKPARYRNYELSCEFYVRVCWKFVFLQGGGGVIASRGYRAVVVSFFFFFAFCEKIEHSSMGDPDW